MFHEDELLYWQGINEQMLDLVDGWWKTDEEIVNALDNLGLSAQEASSNAADAVDTAWQTIEDSLHVFVEGPKTTQMNPYFQGILEDYFDQTIAGIDKEAEVTSEQLTQIAADLKAKQEASSWGTIGCARSWGSTTTSSRATRRIWNFRTT